MIIKILASVLFFPHLLLFVFCRHKEMIIADLYSRSKYHYSAMDTVLPELAVRLFRDRYFRTLFYFRTGGFFSKLLRLFYPREKYFIIDINTKLGKGVQLAHPYATILNAEHIGENLYVNHLVTVGEKNGKKPVIGNNVQLHAGAMVIGGITVGDNAVVGAGAVVVKDVPPNCVAVGNPAKIIRK